jgi:hypothetical protein
MQWTRTVFRAQTEGMSTSTLNRPVPSSAPQAPVEVSRHTTSDGTVLWSRCTCGRLRMVFTPDSPIDRPLATGGRTPGCPNCA